MSSNAATASHTLRSHGDGFSNFPSRQANEPYIPSLSLTLAPHSRDPKTSFTSDAPNYSSSTSYTSSPKPKRRRQKNTKA